MDYFIRQSHTNRTYIENNVKKEFCISFYLLYNQKKGD